MISRRHLLMLLGAHFVSIGCSSNLKMMGNMLPASFDALSMEIAPTNYEGYDVIPCAVRLVDGSIFERVSVIRKEDFDAYWGLADDSAMLELDEVEEVFASRFRVPVEFASVMAMTPEMGMGYRRFWIAFTANRRLLVTAGNLNDFFDLPEGYQVSEIVGVEAVSGYVPARSDAEASSIKWLIL